MFLITPTHHAYVLCGDDIDSARSHEILRQQAYCKLRESANRAVVGRLGDAAARAGDDDDVAGPVVGRLSTDYGSGLSGYPETGGTRQYGPDNQ
jgi:hypothetical protein